MSRINKIRFHYLDVAFSFRNRLEVKAFLLSLFKKEKRVVEMVNYIFCTDDYLLSINQQYLHHNTYTDIITFELSVVDEPLLSDVYISIDRVRENAKMLSLPFKSELRRVMIHGALHLCGYTDKGVSEKTLMTQMEDHYLRTFPN